MLKKISVRNLRLGMHIQSFCGSWMDHPFWRSKFLLESPDDLQKVRQSAVRELWIDTAKGLDVEAGATTLGMAASEEQADEAEVAEQKASAERSLAPTSTAEELARAAAICRSARGAITSMFTDARMGKAINTAVARQVAQDIADSVTRNSGALISLARLKTADDYSYMHSVAVCALMVALSRQLGLKDEESRAAGFAGLMHDLGKMDVPLEVLNKPGRLTDAEFAVVRRHPQFGHQRLVAAGITDPVVLDVCLHHHEKIDGTGYPERLGGDGVSLMARMGAVCDIYDAITSNRPYKPGWDPAESLKRMAEWVGGHLDSRVFQAFVRSLGIYPIGSLVLLSSGKLAVVVDQSKASLLKPVVKTVFSTKTSERVVPEVIDLSLPNTRQTIVGREDPAKWNIPGLDELWSGQVMRP
jgi:HD-GYP domain-containing protein (c-di-GMP phosphodiesterase class II)